MTNGQRRYEEKRAAKAGMSLQEWLKHKQNQKDEKAASPRPNDYNGMDVARKLDRTDDTVAILAVSPYGTVRIDITQKSIDERIKDMNGSMSTSELAGYIGHAFRKGHHLKAQKGNQLANALAVYIGRTESWKMGRMMNMSGMVITVQCSKPDGGYVRPGDMMVDYDTVDKLYQEVGKDYSNYPEVIDGLLLYCAQRAKMDGIKLYQPK